MPLPLGLELHYCWRLIYARNQWYLLQEWSLARSADILKWKKKPSQSHGLVKDSLLISLVKHLRLRLTTNHCSETKAWTIYLYGSGSIYQGLTHIPGKHKYTADTLSQAPVSAEESSSLQKVAELHLTLTVSHIPANSQRISDIKALQSSDPTCSTLIFYRKNDWHKTHYIVLHILVCNLNNNLKTVTYRVSKFTKFIPYCCT